MVLTAACVFIFWCVSQAFGNSFRSVIIAGTTTWTTLFVLFWVALCNMALAELQLALIVLPLAWFEMIVASFIASKLFKRFDY